MPFTTSSAKATRSRRLYDRVDVHSADDGIDIDPFHDGVHVDALGDRVDVDLRHDGVNVHLARDRVDVHLAHDRINVHLAHNRVDVHLTQHPVDVHLADDRVDVHAVDDCSDVDGRDQYVNVDALLHQRREVKAVEYLLDYRRNNSRDDPIQFVTRRCSGKVAPIGEGFDDTSRMQTLIQEGWMHDHPPDGRGARATRRVTDTAALVAAAATPTAASTAAGTVRPDEVPRSGSAMHP